MSDDEYAPKWHRSYALSVVRVLDGSGTVVGAGFLVGPDVVATCAHVVSEALGLDPADHRMPQDPLSLDFPMSGEPGGRPQAVIARVTRWSPILEDGTGDVALLRLETAAPAGARVPPLRGSTDLWNHEYRVLGFPAGMADGVWATGRIRDVQGTGWLQMQGAATDQGIEEGYSGSPVWDGTVGAVVGMTVARDRDRATTTAYVVPMAQVLGLDPDLLPCPYRGLAPFEEEHAAFFCGRDEDIDRLVAAAGQHPVIAVAGRSGTGKSSLVRAGLLPVLRREGAVIADCRIAPGMTAARSFAIALARPLDLDPEVAERLLDLSPEERRTVVERAHGPLVLVMDQFEEVVAADAEHAREFLSLVVALATASRERPYRLRVVLTLRWDSLGSLVTPDLRAVLEDSTVFVTAMSRRQLEEAIVNPAKHAPGLHFEDGLVPRILDDAGAEPGRLPLVESLLRELWERRSGGFLTVGDYDALGGVSGALVQLAEEATQAFTGPDEPGRVQRLLTQLAEPVDDDFVRRPVDFDRLGPELQEIAHRLADSRLVVLGSAPEGTGILELAHQALIEHWPRLRGWLVEDRDFLSWRHRLETQSQQWRTAGQDPGALLRGAPLATALDWTRTRTADVPEEVRTYVRLSHRRQRRDVRRWRVLTLVLAVVVLIAGTLAGVALDRGDRIRHQLDAANAESLGRLAEERAVADPVTGTQLALTAYHSDPANLTARTALAREYLAMRSVDAVFPGFAATSITGMAVSSDGQTVALAAGETITVVTELAGRARRTRRWNPPGAPAGTEGHLSADGHWLAGVTHDNAVLLWDVSRHGGPVRLSGVRSGQTPEGEPTTLTAFSPDSRRLAWLGGRNLTVRDLDRGTDTHHVVAAATSLALTADPAQVVLGHGGSPGSKPPALVVRALSGGHRIRALPPGAVMAGQGATVLSCAKPRDDDSGARASMTVTASDTGRRIVRFPLLYDQCPTGQEPSSANNGFLVEKVGAAIASDATMVRITDLRTGRSYDASTPPDTVTQPRTATAPSVYRGAGGPVLLLARGGSVIRVGRVSPDWYGALPDGSAGDLTSDGRYVVARPMNLRVAGGGQITVRDRDSGAQLGRLSVHTVDGNGIATAVGTSLLVSVRERTGVRLSLYALPALRPIAVYTLPLPGNPQGEPDVVATEQHGRFAAVVGGVLAVWNSRTHQMIGAPKQLGSHQALFRPGHPEQVAVVGGDGYMRLWDTATRGIVATLPADIDTGADGPLAFDAAGERVATVTAQRTVQVWSIETRRPDGPAVPLPENARLAGLTADGYLLLSTDLGDRLNFEDIRTGQTSDALTLPDSALGEQVENGLSLQLGSSAVVPVRLPVTAGQWSGELCARLDRPFTHAERVLLPPGTDATRPCA